MTESPYKVPAESAPDVPETVTAKSNEGMSFGTKLGVLILLILAVFVLCLPRSLHPFAVLLFPAGLLTLIRMMLLLPASTRLSGKLIDPGHLPWGLEEIFEPFYLIWVIYGLLVLNFLLIKNKTVSVWILIIMCTMLVLNCIGCHFFELPGRGA